MNLSPSNAPKKNILVIYGYYHNNASTINDHVNAFLKYSQYKVTLLPLVGTETVPFELSMFDIVVVHYSISVFYEARFSNALTEQIKRYNGIKVIFIQDEYRSVNRVIEQLEYMNFSYLFTCIPMKEVEKVYSKKRLPNLKKVNTLTGYVPEDLLSRQSPSYQERTLDVVYRARKLSAWYGRLPCEKWQIAENFLALNEEYHLKVDIAYLEQERIYGEDWIKFLQSSKASLGVESGASVFDFSGEIQKNVEAHEEKFPDCPFEILEALYFPGLDGNIVINQISPRCFECAALRTLMILYEGEYSGILIPWRHYIPLKKDLSNMNEVVAALKDEKRWNEITENAYQEVALNPKYSFAGFIQEFDTVMSEALQASSFKPLPFNAIAVELGLLKIDQKLKNWVRKTLIISIIANCLRPVYRFLLSLFPASIKDQIRFRIRKLIFLCMN